MKMVLEHCVPYYAFLYALVTPYRQDTLAERAWKAAEGSLDGRPVPEETDGMTWARRWREFVVLTWGCVEGAVMRAEKAAQAQRQLGVKARPTKTAVDWKGLLG